MSVHLCITITSGGYKVDVPIANQSFFMKVWLPLAEKKSLYYIQAMLATTLDQEFLVNLINELKMMKNYATEDTTLTNEESSALIERINYILEEIEPEADYPYLSGWIG